MDQKLLLLLVLSCLARYNVSHCIIAFWAKRMWLFKRCYEETN